MPLSEAAGSVIGGIGSSLISGLISGISSSSAAKKAYKYNRELIQMQQAWQERMSNTAHQREVSDLRKAGLNPILSATGGSGASFGSASASGMSVEPADFGDLGVSSALAIRQQKNQNKLANSQVDLNEKNGKKIESDTDLNSAIKAETLSRQRNIDQSTINSMAITNADLDIKKQELELLQKQIKNYDYDVSTRRIGANASMRGAIASQTSANATATDVKNKQDSDAYGSVLGKTYNSAKGVVKDVLGIPKGMSFEQHFKNVRKYRSLNIHYHKKR